MVNITKYILGLIVVFGFLGINSCDVVDGNYEKIVEIDTNTTKERPQNILITEYTGHKCGNCPPAAEEGKRLQKLYPKGRVIFMAIHAGSFATLDATFTNDLRAPEGFSIMNSFGITLQPTGDINRLLNSSGQRSFAYSEWSSIITANIDKDATNIITFENAEYITDTRKINAKLNIEYFENVTTEDHIAVYIVEDSIVSPQYDYRLLPPLSSKVDDYVHYGVMRGTMNGAWGDLISVTTPKKGEKFDFNVSFTIPEKNKHWRPNHLRLIAMVHDNNNTKVISQVKDTELEIK